MIDNYRLVKLAMNRHQKACEKGFRLVNLDIDIFNSLVDNVINPSNMDFYKEFEELLNE